MMFNEPYVIRKHLLDRRFASCLYHMLVLRQWRGEFKRDDQVPGAASHWGDAILDATLLVLLPEIERCSGFSLLPTYAYARLYKKGDALARHRDREACEVAVTIHLGSQGGEPPPICFEPDIAVDQKPGDAVIYLGDQLEHWRDPYLGRDFGQLFLNFVRKDGDRSHRVYDGRINAFPPKVMEERFG